MSPRTSNANEDNLRKRVKAEVLRTLNSVEFSELDRRPAWPRREVRGQWKVRRIPSNGETGG